MTDGLLKGIVTGTCVDYSYDGLGVVKIDGQPVFVNGLLLGEKADLEITFAKKGMAWAKIVKLHTLSPDRIQPRCPVATACGGCSFQQLRYEAQLAFKRKVIIDDFRKIAGMDVPVEPVIGMENPYFYRNKTQMPLGLDKQKKIISGFYQAKSHRIVPIEKCYIENEKAAPIMADIRRLMKELRIPPYDEDTRVGILRHILIRTSYHTPEVMVVLITNADSFPGRGQFVKALRDAHPEITTIVQNINERDTNVILGNKENVLFGKGYISDTLCGLSFQISSKSFFQINPVQTEVLYNLAIEKAELTGNERILDAYCGIGTIGLVASKHAKEVIGVEVVESAIKDAIFNARQNGIQNARFVTGDAGDFMAKAAQAKERFDVVFMDPPRSGADEKFLNSLLKLAPRRIIYVSCDPATLARDVKILSGKYCLQSIIPVDMFPQTYHVETVVTLVLKK